MSETKVVFKQLVRFSYANVFEPRASEEGGKLKYSVSILIPKSNTADLAAVRKAIAAATEEGKTSKFGGKIPQVNFKNPLRDGDLEKEGDPTYEGCYFINATSVNKPGLVDANLNPILDKADFYSGCWGRAAVNFFPFNNNGNKGIACGLNNIQKVKDGEPLGGSASRPETDFAEFATADENDFLN